MLKLTFVEKKEDAQTIIANAQLDFSYLLINFIATIVACSGLMANSTAVVIGSMLIATLLSPIASVALSVASLNFSQIIKGLITLFCGVALVLIMAFIYGKVFMSQIVTHEMLARTAPSIFDYFIAFFGGLAGGLAMIFKRYSSVMVGVGIATALVPPLSTAGLFFAKSNWDLGCKALELAFINIGLIMLANFIMFKIFNLKIKKHE